MFNSPGKKIMTLAKILFVILSIIPVLAGPAVIFMSESIPGLEAVGEMKILVGVLLIVFGILSAWISSLMLYVVGSIADDLEITRRAAVMIFHKLEEKEVVTKTVVVKEEKETKEEKPLFTVPDYEDEK